MRRGLVSLFVLFIILAGCAPNFGEREEAIIDENVEDSLEETAIIPKHNLTEDTYRVLIDSNLSKARGVISNQIANRVDIDELEEGLRRHSKKVYDPETYYFQEGQYLTEDMLYDWLERYDPDEEPLGLNPELEDAETAKKAEENNPKYLSHILEQNYLTKSDEDVVELAGISIGIAMKSVYRFQAERDGPYYYKDISEQEMLSEANRIGNEVAQRIREVEGLENIPIMMSVFQEAPQNSLAPGNFVAKANIPGDKASISGWEEIDEENVLFSANHGENTYPDTWATLVDFESDVGEYFPNYVSVIGNGFYKDGTLQRLTVEIPVSFYGKAELIGFTQYVYGLVLSGFPKDYQLEINITSGNKQEALIVRDVGEEEGFVHIYH